MKHKHYDMIVAWAAGEEVEYRPAGIDGAYNSWTQVINPIAFEGYNVFRIKPELMKTVGFKQYIRKDSDGYFMSVYYKGDIAPHIFADFVKEVDTEWQYYTITGEV